MQNRLWLDAVLEGRYPQDVLDLLSPALPEVIQDGDLSYPNAGPDLKNEIRDILAQVPEWDFRVFWLHAQLAARGFDFYDREIVRGFLTSVHASPRNDEDIFTERTPEERIAFLFEDVEADVVVCGHTHMQFERVIAGKRVINSGSVGMRRSSPRGIPAFTQAAIVAICASVNRRSPTNTPKSVSPCHGGM